MGAPVAALARDRADCRALPGTTQHRHHHEGRDMPPDEARLLDLLWYDYRSARRRDRGRWLAASRGAKTRVRLAVSILADARVRWGSAP